jgi:hypothetical protein
VSGATSCSVAWSALSAARDRMSLRSTRTHVSGPPLGANARGASRGRSALPRSALPRSALAVLIACGLGSGCKSAAQQACLDQFASAQTVVLDVKPEELPSVETSLTAVSRAIDSCSAAGRGGEVEELSKARTQLATHRDRLVRRAELRAQRKPETSAEDLALLVKSGDPNCPRGQAYVHGKGGPRVRCVGPQPIDMNRRAISAYFEKRGFRRLPVEAPTELRFIYGAETTVFQYAEPDESAPPRCVIIYPPPGTSWQEATARLTGAAPARLKAGGSVPSSAGPRRLDVEEGPDKVIARIGDCAR